MSALALVADLMFSSRITAAARAAGRPVTVVRSADALAGKLDGKTGLVLVDLDADGAMDAIAMAAAASPRPRIVAFGSHVDRQALAAARAGGADEALPRSAFVARLDAELG